MRGNASQGSARRQIRDSPHRSFGPDYRRTIHRRHSPENYVKTLDFSPYLIYIDAYFFKVTWRTCVNCI
jgi:hypothetical protein